MEADTTLMTPRGAAIETIWAAMKSGSITPGSPQMDLAQMLSAKLLMRGWAQQADGSPVVPVVLVGCKIPLNSMEFDVLENAMLRVI